jgi:hypothetical protein
VTDEVSRRQLFTEALPRGLGGLLRGVLRARQELHELAAADAASLYRWSGISPELREAMQAAREATEQLRREHPEWVPRRPARLRRHRGGHGHALGRGAQVAPTPEVAERLAGPAGARGDGCGPGDGRRRRSRRSGAGVIAEPAADIVVLPDLAADSGGIAELPDTFPVVVPEERRPPPREGEGMRARRGRSRAGGRRRGRACAGEAGGCVPAPDHWC